MSTDLYALLDHLATASRAPHQWRAWRVTPVGGGANNLLVRATSDDADLAVKWTIRDERDRAGREYAALSAVQQAGLDSAPAPLLLDRERYPQPVVVQAWLAGDVLDAAPQSDPAWLALVDHFCAIHTLTPARITVPLRDAVTNAASVAAGRAMIAQRAARAADGAAAIFARAARCVRCVAAANLARAAARAVPCGRELPQLHSAARRLGVSRLGEQRLGRRRFRNRRFDDSPSL